MPPKAPQFWSDKNALSTLLLPAAAAYGAAVQIRRMLATPVRAPVPVICIGNLVAGGAGKTPVALAVAEIITALGVKPFFLSRGYGGTLHGPVRVNPAHHTATEVGDEPLLLAERAPTVVAADRVAGAKLACAEGAQAIIMDDGFQNPHLFKDFSLVVVDAKSGFCNGRLLPAGPLREPVAAGLQRADAVLVMDGELAVASDKPQLHARLVPDAEAAQFRGKKVVAFAGIGRPEKFRATLESIGCEMVAFMPFADHHVYAEQELAHLDKKAREAGALMVTTAKDAMRLPLAWRARVSVVKVKAVISEAEQLKAMLRKVLHVA